MMKILLLICFLLALSQQIVFGRPQDPLSDEYIEWVQSKSKTWKTGRNFHKDTSMRYFKKLMGSRNSPHPMDMDEKQVEPIPQNFEIPTNFDAREQWPYCPTIKEIRDQGACGAGWAISTVEVISDRTCTMSNGKVNFHYSTEDLISCCNTCGDGCDGGYPGAAFYYWIHIGIVSGGVYNSSQGCTPYLIPPCEHHVNGTKPDCADEHIPTPVCLTDCEGYYPILYQDDLHRGVDDQRFKNMYDAQVDLYANGPISATFSVFHDFLTYKSGVYQNTDASGYLGLHSVKIIGYGEEDGVPYWLCANSWNTDWGDQGFFKILRGHNECNIEMQLLSGIPKF